MRPHHGESLMCPSPFVIWFHHRSGSTHLSSLLDSHPAVASWGEFFYLGEAGATQDVYTRSGTPNEATFLDDFYSYRWDAGGANLTETDPEPGSFRAVGFKLKYQQAESYPGVMRYLREQPRIKVIHLVRTNLLAALVSSAMIPRLLDRYRRPNLLSSDSSGSLERTVRLDPDTLVHDLQELASRIDRARDAIAGFDSMEITFENLVDHPGVTCRSLLEFLKVDPTVDLESRYVKIMPRSIRDSLNNWPEISVAIEGTPYASMLDEER